jgi:hypothetical protein
VVGAADGAAVAPWPVVTANTWMHLEIERARMEEAEAKAAENRSMAKKGSKGKKSSKGKGQAKANEKDEKRDEPVPAQQEVCVS